MVTAQSAPDPRFEPNLHCEPSPLDALASRDVDDAIEGRPVLGDDREEDLEDVSGLLDNCISVARGRAVR